MESRPGDKGCSNDNGGNVLKTNVDAIEEMIRVNLLGLVYTVEMSLPSMLRRGAGHIVAISSLSAYKGMPGESAYCASKAAVNTFMDGLRVQLRGRGVDVSTICPGFVKTPMTAIDDYPMPFAMEPEEAARRIVRAIGRRAGVAATCSWRVSRANR